MHSKRPSFSDCPRGAYDKVFDIRFSGSFTIVVTEAAAQDELLLESGDFLLLESGDKILLET